jgi:hypothetical protein
VTSTHPKGERHLSDYVITEEDRRAAGERLARADARRSGLPLPSRPPAYETAPYPVWLVKTIAKMKRRARDARYDASEKGRARSRRYNDTYKGKERYIAYYHSPKGSERNFARYLRDLKARAAYDRDRLDQIDALLGSDDIRALVRADEATLARVAAILGIR